MTLGVGKMRADRHRTEVMGVVDNRENSMVKPVPNSTWADVVRGTQAKAIRGQEMLKCNKSNKSVSRPLSRNNPVTLSESLS